MIMSTSVRSSSCSLFTKCFTTAATPSPCMPSTNCTTSFAPRYASSPERYSALRPFTATRFTFTPGPSAILAPLALNSWPIACAHRRIAPASHVAATASAHGHDVTWPSCALEVGRKPWGPSCIVSGGMASRGTPLMRPTQLPLSLVPLTIAHFSAFVIWPTRSAAQALISARAPGTPGGVALSQRDPCSSTSSSSAAVAPCSPQRAFAGRYSAATP
mmetsp:Transcript_111016/g.310567  ORF Transcript_111016/g.310567 Transcript_111016/m.310567 type:complete len:217 (-) Transcript_111016:42-692(-)